MVLLVLLVTTGGGACGFSAIPGGLCAGNDGLLLVVGTGEVEKKEVESSLVRDRDKTGDTPLWSWGWCRL